MLRAAVEAGDPALGIDPEAELGRQHDSVPPVAGQAAVALQRLRNLRFHRTDNDAILAYSKREGDNLILVVINLDPTFAQETVVHWNMAELGLQIDNFAVTDLIDGAKYDWSAHTYVRLDPTRLSGKVVHIAQVKL